MQFTLCTFTPGLTKAGRTLVIYSRRLLSPGGTATAASQKTKSHAQVRPIATGNGRGVLRCPNNYALSHDCFGPALSFTGTNQKRNAVYLINSLERKFKAASANRHKQNAAEHPSWSRRCEGRNAGPGPRRTERAANPRLPGTGRCETRAGSGSSTGTGTAGSGERQRGAATPARRRRNSAGSAEPRFGSPVTNPGPVPARPSALPAAGKGEVAAPAIGGCRWEQNGQLAPGPARRSRERAALPSTGASAGGGSPRRGRSARRRLPAARSGRRRWAEALRQPPGGHPCSRRAPPPPRQSQRGGGSGCGHLGERKEGEKKKGGKREGEREGRQRESREERPESNRSIVTWRSRFTAAPRQPKPTAGSRRKAARRGHTCRRSTYPL